MPSFKDSVEALARSQTKKNWERFGRELKKSGIKYYSVTFDKGKVNSKEDLRKAYAELYDSSGRAAYRIPIVVSEGGRIRGATIYLKGLQNANKA